MNPDVTNTFPSVADYSPARWTGTSFERFDVDERPCERAVFTKLGFDCRRGCTDRCHHKTKGKPLPDGGNYGWGGDDHGMVVRFEDGVAALMFYTTFLDGAVRLSRLSDDRLDLDPSGLEWCYGFPVEDESIRSGTPGTACAFQRKGVCYGDEHNTIVGARDLCAPHRELLARVADPSPEGASRQILSELTPLWADLARSLIERYGVAVKKHSELSVQCPTCHGEGVIARSGHP